MSSIDEIWKQKDLVILDGAMATELERKGLNLNDSLWSARALVEQPDMIKAVHYDYFVSGADCSTSASYQATIPGYLKSGYTKSEAESLIARSMTLLLAARDEWWANEGRDSGRPHPLAAAAIGPYGAFLANGSEYTGDYTCTEEEYRAFHLPRLQILKDAGTEIFAVETLPRLDEAIACANMLEELGCDYWLSFTFHNARQISEGTSIEEVAAALKEGFPHLKAVGVNCTPPAFVEGIVRNFKAVSSLPVCVYPNRGEVYDAVSKTWHGSADGKTFGNWAAEWYRAGATIIGGCCRTRPEDIKEVADWYDKESHLLHLKK
ncbi:MAG: homocysteine S-methyltransferase [Oscillibacter sp.]|jgi:homocysteine S-methyltransferase|nr:homocysteine S-methyltransferase [Oscillibacter sp.]